MLPRLRLPRLASVRLIVAVPLMAACGGSSSNGLAESNDDLSKGPDRCGTAVAPLRIMPVGDSITEARSGYNSYRRSLWKELIAAGCHIDFVGSRKGVSDGRRDGRQVSPPNPDFDLDHEGRWGYRAEQVSEFIQSRTTTFQPNVLLVHLGTNDLFQGASPERAFEALESVIAKILDAKADARIYVAQIIPSERQSNEIRDYNQLVEQLPSRFGANVIVVNQHEGFPLSETYDGVHPNAAGEERIARKWAGAILSPR